MRRLGKVCLDKVVQKQRHGDQKQRGGGGDSKQEQDGGGLGGGGVYRMDTTRYGKSSVGRVVVRVTFEIV